VPNAATHIATGRLVALAITALDRTELPTDVRLAELLGGQLVASFASCLPDILEPAVHAHHRSICHSVSTGAAVIAVLSEAEKVAAQYRAAGLAARQRAALLPPYHPDRQTEAFRSFAWHVLAGALRAAGPCYLAHLAADSLTKRGIPLLL
jgi:hypothetical protein